MVQRSSVRRDRLLREFGANIRRWRKVNGMSAAELARRSFVTRATLHDLEEGTGTARTDSLLAVLIALGIADSLVASADPFTNAAARARLDDILKVGTDP